jgi:hypothetical protein
LILFYHFNTGTGAGLGCLPEVSADGQTWFSDAAHLQQIDVVPLDDQFDTVTGQDLTSVTISTPPLFRLWLSCNLL